MLDYSSHDHVNMLFAALPTDCGSTDCTILYTSARFTELIPELGIRPGVTPLSRILAPLYPNTLKALREFHHPHSSQARSSLSSAHDVLLVDDTGVLWPMRVRCAPFMGADGLPLVARTWHDPAKTCECDVARPTSVRRALEFMTSCADSATPSHHWHCESSKSACSVDDAEHCIEEACSYSILPVHHLR